MFGYPRSGWIALPVAVEVAGRDRVPTQWVMGVIGVELVGAVVEGKPQGRVKRLSPGTGCDAVFGIAL